MKTVKIKMEHIIALFFMSRQEMVMGQDRTAKQYKP